MPRINTPYNDEPGFVNGRSMRPEDPGDWCIVWDLSQADRGSLLGDYRWAVSVEPQGRIAGMKVKDAAIGAMQAISSGANDIGDYEEKLMKHSVAVVITDPARMQDEMMAKLEEHFPQSYLAERIEALLGATKMVTVGHDEATKLPILEERGDATALHQGLRLIFDYKFGRPATRQVIETKSEMGLDDLLSQLGKPEFRKALFGLILDQPGDRKDLEEMLEQ